MLPFGHETVTLYARNRATGADGRSRDSWVRHVLTGCSWRHTASQSMQENAVRGMTQCTCRIPAGQQCPNVGDVLILGTVYDEPASAKELNELLEAHREHGAFRVSAVANNAMQGSPMPHYAARGD